ncbi:MAG: hypothetical protein V3G42_06400 [Oscillospiraceae bacterium]
MYRATREIYEAFQDNDLKCIVKEYDHSSILVAGMTGKTTSFEVYFVSKDNDNDVSLRVPDLVHIDPMLMTPLLHAVNKLNFKYRYAKFVVDEEEHTVGIVFDVPLNAENTGPIALELLARACRAVDEAYPVLVQYAGEEE